MDFRLFVPYITRTLDVDTIKKVDIPPPPANVFEIYTDNGKIGIPLDEMRQYISKSCVYCPDMTSEFSDISVGVLEGHPDMNTMIIRTKDGEDLVKKAVEQGYLIVQDMPQENLNHFKNFNPFLSFFNNDCRWWISDV